MFKKMMQNAKAKCGKRNEEIAKFKAEWYARPYLNRVKKPAITFAVSFALGLYLQPHSELVSGLMLVVAFGAGFLTVVYGLGGRPLSPVESAEASNTMDGSDSPTMSASLRYSYRVDNIFHN